MKTRFWELDAARGVAIVMMVFFHILFDLRFFLNRAPALPAGFWFWFPRATAGLFIFIAGVSLAIAYGKSGRRDFYRKIVLRGAKIFALGLLVTAATFLFLQNNGTIWFGILHFIGIGLIISSLFVASDVLLIGTAFASFAIGLAIDKITVNTPYLLWLGLKFPGFYSLDYFPLFPWLGVMLLGVAVGKRLFAAGERTFAKPLGENNPASKMLSFLGGHSLAIYLLHQPVLVGLVWLTARMAG